nr:dockerin type I repeat-containing protein [candidate division Zixibacteria bacterium]
MRPTLKSLSSQSGRLFLIALFLLFAIPALAQEPEIVIRVDSVATWSEQTGIEIPVYLANYADTIAGLEFWMVVDRSDIFEFQHYWQQVSETDSVVHVNFDTAGTLLSGWDIVAAVSRGESGHDVKVTALLNDLKPPVNTAFMAPQNGDIPLIKFFADTYDIPEFITDSTADIIINPLQSISFSDLYGHSLGTSIDTIVDTNCYECVAWMEPPDDTICLEWQPAPGTTGDSCVYDTSYYPHLDTNLVELIPGAVTIIGFLCGDVNNNGLINILDATYLISYLYLGGPAPIPEAAGDVDNSGFINILDVTYLIKYLYNGGPAPEC